MGNIFSYNGITSDEIMLGHDLMAKLFDSNDTNDTNDTNNTNILDKLIYLQIHNLTLDKFNFYNLMLCPNLISLSIGLESELSHIPNEILELKKLEYLYIRGDSYLNNVRKINGLSRLSNLKTLELNLTQNEFPFEILQLKNLQTLKLRCITYMRIPNEICYLTNLKHFQNTIITQNELQNIKYIHDRTNIFTIDNIMMIVKYNNDIIIPPNINKLNILDAQFDKLTNLPLSISHLRIGNNVEFLQNLPIGLEKLYIGNKLIDKVNMRLPYGCVLIYY
jgi:hypothetical protein